MRGTNVKAGEVQVQFPVHYLVKGRGNISFGARRALNYFQYYALIR